MGTYFTNYQNFMLLAGDARRLYLKNMLGELFFPTIQELYDKGAGWVITPNQRILTYDSCTLAVLWMKQITYAKLTFGDLSPEAKVFGEKLYPITDFDTH